MTIAVISSDAVVDVAAATTAATVEEATSIKACPTTRAKHRDNMPSRAAIVTRIRVKLKPTKTAPSQALSTDPMANPSRTRTRERAMECKKAIIVPTPRRIKLAMHHLVTPQLMKPAATWLAKTAQEPSDPSCQLQMCLSMPRRVPKP
jgi:hypothetical protein